MFDDKQNLFGIFLQRLYLSILFLISFTIEFLQYNVILVYDTMRSDLVGAEKSQFVPSPWRGEIYMEQY